MNVTVKCESDIKAAAQAIYDNMRATQKPFETQCSESEAAQDQQGQKNKNPRKGERK